MSNAAVLAPGTLSLATSQPPRAGEGAVPLCELCPGQRGEVSWIHEHHPFAGRLRDLGFAPGSSLVVRQRAPFRGPIEYEVRGSRFCLRFQDTRDIYVIPS